MAPKVVVTLPADRIILSYDMSALEDGLKKHRANIKMFEDGIANEKKQMAALSEIIDRKRALEAERRP